MRLQGWNMWRKPGEKTEKKLEEEEEWQELSTAPVGILELVIFGNKTLSSICILLQFKFASSLDYFLVVFGVVLALCGGAGGPILMVMFGAIIQVNSPTNSHLWYMIQVYHVQSFTLNDYQVDLGIDKATGNWTKVQLAQAEVMEAVTWYEWCKHNAWLSMYKWNKVGMIFIYSTDKYI